MAEANAWIGLLEEAREALAHLRVEELEGLALKAQQALDASTTPGGDDLREVAAQHRVLGGLLQATEQNLDVLRRLRSRGHDSRGQDARPRWAR